MQQRPLLRGLSLISCFFMLTGPSDAQNLILKDWVQSKGFKVRLNPSDNPLVGEIYPNDDVNKGSRINRMENCWPPEFITKFRSDDWRENGATSEIRLSFQRTDLSAFVKLARKKDAGADDDVTRLQTELNGAVMGAAPRGPSCCELRNGKGTQVRDDRD